MKNKLISFVTAAFLAFGSVAFPQECADAVRTALNLCLRVVIPSLFPFFVLSAFMNESGVSERIGLISAPLMARLFRLSGAGASAVVLGMIGGYPIGADCVRALYTSGKLKKREAEHLLIFCNNSGPAFILGAVGCGIFGSAKIGLTLLAIHWVSAGIIGVLLRFRTKTDPQTESSAHSAPFASALCTSVKSAMGTMLNVSAFIIFFAVMTELMHNCVHLPRVGVSGAVCTGLLELTSGMSALQTVGTHPQIAFPLAAAFLGFGGLCVHAQTAALIEETDLSLTPFVWGKAAHAAVSFVLARILAPKSIPVSTMSQTGTDYAGLAVASVAVFSFFILFLFSEKRTGNR